MYSRIGQFVFVAMCLTVSMNLNAAQPADGIDFAGEYVMQGKGFGANDSAYTGTCSLRHADQGYQVSCYNQYTRHTYVGKGLARGDTLAVFIGDTLQGDHNVVYAGEYLVLYQRNQDGNLAGTWLHTKSQFAGAETLTRKKSDGKP